MPPDRDTLEDYMGPDTPEPCRLSWKKMVETETLHISWRLRQTEIEGSEIDVIQIAHARLYHDAWYEAQRHFPGKRIRGMTIRFDVPDTTMSYSYSNTLEKYIMLVARVIVDVEDGEW